MTILKRAILIAFAALLTWLFIGSYNDITNTAKHEEPTPPEENPIKEEKKPSEEDSTAAIPVSFIPASESKDIRQHQKSSEPPPPQSLAANTPLPNSKPATPQTSASENTTAAPQQSHAALPDWQVDYSSFGSFEQYFNWMRESVGGKFFVVDASNRSILVEIDKSYKLKSDYSLAGLTFNTRNYTSEPAFRSLIGKIRTELPSQQIAVYLLLPQSLQQRIESQLTRYIKNRELPSLRIIQGYYTDRSSKHSIRFDKAVSTQGTEIPIDLKIKI